MWYLPRTGVAVMWRKSLNSVKVKRYDDSRMIGVEIKLSDSILTLINVYMIYMTYTLILIYLFALTLHDELFVIL